MTFAFIKAEFDHFNFKPSSPPKNNLITKNSKTAHLLLLHLLLLRGVGRPSPQHLLLRGSRDLSGQKAGRALRRSPCCRCQSCQMKNTEGGESCTLLRSAEAERKSCGHTETGEANPVFGGLRTGQWVCYMYFSASRAKSSG